MPVKNTANFLPECLDSILAQTHISWELLAVDDGSSDESFRILEAYAQKDKRIQAIKNQGKGIIHALRTAYQNAQGELMTRMDSDDKMHPSKLALMSSALQKHGQGGIAVGLVEYFSEQALGQGYLQYAQWLNNLTKKARNYSEIYKECVIPSPCWMVWRTDLERCGAFRLDVYPEDYDLCFRFYENKLQILPVLKTLHYWRDYSERTSRNDPNYLDNRFTPLKIHYFLQLEYQKERPLFLWGAGKKGKYIAQQLLEKDVSFHWICDNPKKIGKDIYGVKMQHFDTLLLHSNPQIIVSVSAPDGVIEIQNWLKARGLKGFFFG